MSGKELKRLRVKMGITQVELGKRLGVAGNSVARWERGARDISIPMERFIRLIAQVHIGEKETDHG